MSPARLDEMPVTDDPGEMAGFIAARPDAITWAQLSLLALVLVSLMVTGGLDVAVSAAAHAWGEAGRGAGFAILGLALAYLTVARMPASYGVTLDERHGPILEIRRMAMSPVKVRLGSYQMAVRRRVLFPWLPLFSGTRLFGLRGARVEESILGAWSFGCDGHRSVVLTGAGRPATLVSPREPEQFIEMVSRFFERGGS